MICKGLTVRGLTYLWDPLLSVSRFSLREKTIKAFQHQSFTVPTFGIASRAGLQ